MQYNITCSVRYTYIHHHRGDCMRVYDVHHMPLSSRAWMRNERKMSRGERTHRCEKSKRNKIICSFVRCLRCFHLNQSKHDQQGDNLTLDPNIPSSSFVVWTNRLRRISIFRPTTANTFSLFMCVFIYICFFSTYESFNVHALYSIRKIIYCTPNG